MSKAEEYKKSFLKRTETDDQFPSETFSKELVAELLYDAYTVGEKNALAWHSVKDKDFPEVREGRRFRRVLTRDTNEVVSLTTYAEGRFAVGLSTVVEWKYID